MDIISDLTRDIRPTLTSLLLKAINETLQGDKNRPLIDADLLEYENQTFYYRVLVLFMQTSAMYYTPKELELWSRKLIMKETILPKLN